MLLRSIMLVLLSCIAGLLFALCAGYVLGFVAYPWPIVAMFGVGTGTLMSPVLVVSLLRKSIAVGYAVIVVPTAACTMIAAAMRPHDPFRALLASAVCYSIACIVSRFALPDALFRDGECQHCGYSLTGLPPGAACPECGRDA